MIYVKLEGPLLHKHNYFLKVPLTQSIVEPEIP